MSKRIILINGTDTPSFPAFFNEAVVKHNMDTMSVDSRDCLISIGYEGSATIICQNLPLPIADTAYFIKRTNQDTYRTYLIGTILKDQAPLYADEANLLSDKSADKMTMMVILPLCGIKVPRSFLTTKSSYLNNQSYVDGRMKYPCVVKKAGSRGKKVWLVRDQSELLEKLELDEGLTLIQEYILNDHDLRVFVMDGEVITVVKRSSADGFYNNVSKGGKAERAEITEEEKDICIRATKAGKLRVSGVDLVRSSNGPLVFEVNKSPQMNIFEEASGIDLERVYSERVVDELNRSSK